nr:DUF3265 domain-containing protein [Vibrio sp. THAF190c]
MRNAWHFYYPSNLMIKIVYIGISIALLSP